MSTYHTNRKKGRKPREIGITLSNKSTGQAFTLDFSQGGLRICGVGLVLQVGEKVSFSVGFLGKTLEINGLVARVDGPTQIKRTGRNGNAYFVKVTDANFQEFVKKEMGV